MDLAIYSYIVPPRKVYIYSFEKGTTIPPAKNDPSPPPQIYIYIYFNFKKFKLWMNFTIPQNT